jgi:hypothetical protein
MAWSKILESFVKLRSKSSISGNAYTGIFVVIVPQVFVWFSTLIFLFYKMLFMNRLNFSSFVDFFVRIFKTRAECGFFNIRQYE